MLPQFRALHMLDVGNNLIGDPGARKITEVLPQLSRLYIDNNMIGLEGGEGLARVMSQYLLLSHVNLGHNQIFDRDTGGLREC
jgi:hypothetical protein